MLSWVLIATAFEGLSQNFDTIVLSKKAALKVLQKGYEAKALEAQRDLLLNQVDTLKARITIKEMMVTNLNGQIDDYKNIVRSHENIIGNMKEQKTIFESQITVLNKEIRKQRRGKKWVAFLGILTTGAMTYFYLTK